MELNQFLEKYAKKPVHHYPDKVIDKPMVSVCVQTYQHALYIKECLDGILMQKTNFDFEILLGEDASKDGTREICIDYAKKYPEKIRLFLHHRENNIVINGTPTGRFNFLHNLLSAQGKYIALCEGDDYWTDPLKLQKQVEALESHPDIHICSHPSLKKNENNDSEELTGYWGKEIKIFTFEEVVMNYSATAPMQSIMIRNKMDENLLRLLNKALGGHSVIQMYFAYKNGLLYLPDVMAVYRLNTPNSMTRTILRNRKLYFENQMKGIQTLKLFKTMVADEFRYVIEQRILKSYRIMINSGQLNYKQFKLVLNDSGLIKNKKELLKVLPIYTLKRVKSRLALLIKNIQN